MRAIVLLGLSLMVAAPAAAGEIPPKTLSTILVTCLEGAYRDLKKNPVKTRDDFADDACFCATREARRQFNAEELAKFESKKPPQNLIERQQKLTADCRAKAEKGEY